MEESLNIFLQCDMVYVNDGDFYDELADIGKATKEAIGQALSESGEFLGCLTDVGGVFSTSKTACLGTTRGYTGLPQQRHERWCQPRGVPRAQGAEERSDGPVCQHEGKLEQLNPMGD